MDTFQINGIEVPLLEPPHKDYNTPRTILYVLFKHKRFIAATFLVVSLPIIIAMFLRPTKYLAVSKILIKPSRAFLSVSPTVGEGPLTLSPSPEIINSEIQIIKSQELLGRLAKEVPFPEKNKGNNRESNNKADIQRKTLTMVGRLDAAPIRTSNLIRISLASANPEWAAKAVNKAAELYLEQHLKVYKTRGIEEFYGEQDKKLQMELDKAEKALKEYQEREKIVDAGQELTSNLARLAAFETNLRNTESSIRESNEKIRIFEAQLKEQQPAISSSTQVSINPVYDQIRDKLIHLELERDSLLQRYTANDRLVRDKEKEIADLNKRLANILSDPKAVWSTNPVHQGILHSLLAARAELNALEARRNSLLKQVAAYSASAAELKKKSFLYDRLQQDVNTNKEALLLYKKKAEEARISDAMDEQKFTNATILERATIQRAGWSLWITLLVTVLASMAIAVAGAFVMEFFNTTVRNEADVEEQIGLPVLATIQYYNV